MSVTEAFIRELLDAGWVRADDEDRWRNPHGGQLLMSFKNALTYKRKRRAFTQWEEDLRRVHQQGREEGGPAWDEAHAQLTLLTEARKTFQESLQYTDYRVPFDQRVRSARLTKVREHPEGAQLQSALTFLLNDMPYHTLGAPCLPELFVQMFKCGLDGEEPWTLGPYWLSALRWLLEQFEPLSVLFELAGNQLQWRETVSPNTRGLIAMYVYERYHPRIGV